MNPSCPIGWAELLWNYFKPTVEAGSPVYLCCDDSLLNRLFSEYSGDKSVQSSEYFHNACSSLLSESRCSLSLAPRTFETQENGFSLAIILAVQQVLVVERMISDENFSQESYFPRYREILGVPSGNMHSNPLPGSDFTNIWLQVKKELLSIDGRSDQVVTFSKGAGPRDLNRNYPISQALFSMEDLYRLRQEVINISNLGTNSGLLRFFRRSRYALSARGRRLIRNESIRPRLYSQFREYLKEPAPIILNSRGPSSDKTSAESIESGELMLITKEVGFSLTHVLSYWIDIDNQVTGRSLLDIIKRKWGERSVLLLADEQTHYSTSPSESVVEPGVSFALAFLSSGSQIAETILSSALGPSWKEHFEEVKVHDECHVLICSSYPKEANPLTFSHRQLTGYTAEPVHKLRLGGGLRVDARSPTFLIGYPPTEILYGGVVLNSGDAILSGGVKVAAGEFLSSLHGVKSYSFFHLEKGDSSIEFSISTHREDVKEDVFGFEIYEPGRLAAVSGSIDSEAHCLRGCYLRLPLKHIGLQLDEFTVHDLSLVVASSEESWLPITEEGIKALVARAANTNFPKQVIDLVIEKLEEHRSAPAIVVYRHLNRKELISQHA